MVLGNKGNETMARFAKIDPRKFHDPVTLSEIFSLAKRRQTLEHTQLILVFSHQMVS